MSTKIHHHPLNQTNVSTYIMVKTKEGIQGGYFYANTILLTTDRHRLRKEIDLQTRGTRARCYLFF